MALQSVGIIGAGAWGTALAVTSRRAGRDVLIWAYELETLIDINEAHRNGIYLPGVSSTRRSRRPRSSTRSPIATSCSWRRRRSSCARDRRRARALM